MKVLIADDDRISRMGLQGALEDWGYEVVAVADGAAAWQTLQLADSPALALVDWVMPGLDGIDVVRKVRSELHNRYVYLIMITSKSASVVQAMEAGADDFIAKPFDLEELKVRVRAGQRIVGLQRELERRALHDSLTGVLNRGAISQALDIELTRRSRTHAPAAVVMVDVDHFKQVNDTHGHATGDDVLREVARRMAAAVRPYDALGRFGGEEFLVVLPNCTAASACEVAERVRAAVAASPAALSGSGGGVPVTVSLGVACIESNSHETGHSLMSRADAALYRAKQNGRNRVVMATMDGLVSSDQPLAEATDPTPRA
ncbi:MAG TPA: diguanylate cyclase [Rubrivivax sp.]|nr:diguanylate cyclase [Rubrivivax sp.]